VTPTMPRPLIAPPCKAATGTAAKQWSCRALRKTDRGAKTDRAIGYGHILSPVHRALPLTPRFIAGKYVRQPICLNSPVHGAFIIAGLLAQRPAHRAGLSDRADSRELPLANSKKSSFSTIFSKIVATPSSPTAYSEQKYKLALLSARLSISTLYNSRAPSA
jgi:hypothetical protein